MLPEIVVKMLIKQGAVHIQQYGINFVPYGLPAVRRSFFGVALHGINEIPNFKF